MFSYLLNYLLSEQPHFDQQDTYDEESDFDSEEWEEDVSFTWITNYHPLESVHYI